VFHSVDMLAQGFSAWAATSGSGLLPVQTGHKASVQGLLLVEVGFSLSIRGTRDYTGAAST